MVYTLSFDPATKSLAVSITEYNVDLSENIDNEFKNYLKKKDKIDESDINKLLENYLNLLTEVDKLLENRIKIHYLNVIDLIPGKTVKRSDIQEISKSLYNYLNTVIDPIIEKYNKDNNKDDWIFLLEYQMGPNIQSNSISSQIIYHLSKYTYPIELIGPTLKNKIMIGGVDASYSNFLETHTTNYAANKSHSRYNFLKLIKDLKKESMVKNIKKKHIDDIGDSVIQGLAYMIKYKEF